jgi:hypothetical protein
MFVRTGAVAVSRHEVRAGQDARRTNITLVLIGI